jgi:hypothetical protein
MTSNVYNVPKEMVRMLIWNTIENIVVVSTYWRKNPNKVIKKMTRKTPKIN